MENTSKATTSATLTNKQVKFIKNMQRKLNNYIEEITQNKLNHIPETTLEIVLGEVVLGIGKLPPLVPNLRFSKYYFTSEEGLMHPLSEYEFDLFIQDIEMIQYMLQGLLNNRRSRILQFFKIQVLNAWKKVDYGKH